jgi:hypothetical protein
LLSNFNYFKNIFLKVSVKRKRSLSKERFVKVTLVADHTMVERYKNDDLENYLLTIMNMVWNKSQKNIN